MKVTTRYAFGPFQLDAREGLLLRDGRPVPLTPKAFDTLLALVEQSGHVIGKEELMRRVWPDSFVEENNLSQNISLLRKALQQGGAEDVSYIETVPRRGYRFTAEVVGYGEEWPDLVVRERTRTRVVVEEEDDGVGVAERRDGRPEFSAARHAGAQYAAVPVTAAGRAGAAGLLREAPP
ncbi:MAG: winged helix-turn-helix domain-containing protein, partial [Pyrinomonadaceae bacterium]